MKTEHEIEKRIQELRSRTQDEDGHEDPEAYLDEEEQTELSVLQWVLDG